MRHDPASPHSPANTLNLAPLCRTMKLGQHTGGNLPRSVTVGLVQPLGTMMAAVIAASRTGLPAAVRS